MKREEFKEISEKDLYKCRQIVMDNGDCSSYSSEICKNCILMEPCKISSFGELKITAEKILKSGNKNEKETLYSPLQKNPAFENLFSAEELLQLSINTLKTKHTKATQKVKELIEKNGILELKVDNTIEKTKILKRELEESEKKRINLGLALIRKQEEDLTNHKLYTQLKEAVIRQALEISELKRGK